MDTIDIVKTLTGVQSDNLEDLFQGYICYKSRQFSVDITESRPVSNSLEKVLASRMFSGKDPFLNKFLDYQFNISQKSYDKLIEIYDNLKNNKIEKVKCYEIMGNLVQLTDCTLYPPKEIIELIDKLPLDEEECRKDLYREISFDWFPVLEMSTAVHDN